MIKVTTVEKRPPRPMNGRLHGFDGTLDALQDLNVPKLDRDELTHNRGLAKVRPPMSTPDYWNPELETMPWPIVQQWQARQIAAALPDLRARSLMYGQLFASLPNDAPITTLADLARLPFTAKDDLRAAQELASDERPFGLNQAVPSSDIVQTLCSSGTTGKPLYYALTQRDLDMFSDAIASTWYTTGVRKHDVVAHLVGLPMVAGGLPYADGFRRIGATLCWLGGFPTERILLEMRRLRVTTILATTSFGQYLAEQWEEVGQQTGIASKLTRFLGGGEPGLSQPQIRSRIGQGLGITQVRDLMGLGDVISALWGECDQQDGMHFNAQRYVAVELIDPDSGQTLPWTDGATGELVYSAFARDATPLLRYRSRDHAMVVASSCACGRTSPKIRCIGRTDDMLIYRAMNVFPTAIRDLIAAQFAGQVEPLIRIFKERADQVRFDEPIPLQVEAASAFDLRGAAALAGAIEQAVRVQLQVRVTVTVLASGTLPKSAYKNPLTALRPL